MSLAPSFAPAAESSTAASSEQSVDVGVPVGNAVELPSPGSPDWVHRFDFDPNSSDPAGPASNDAVANCKARLNAHTRAMVKWHFSPETGSPFWLEKAESYDFDPLSITDFDGLKQFPTFEDDWLRGGPV
ncbi:MAG: hypothetical protein AAF907_13825, partial [Planctomycetota bacterium]